MRGVQAVIRIIDGITEHSGRCVAWLTLVMMIVTCTVVVLRYGVGIGSIAMQESVTYLHGMVFMIAIAYAMKHDAHVRVDIVYARLSEANRDWINLVGHLLFLLRIADRLQDDGGLPQQRLGLLQRVFADQIQARCGHLRFDRGAGFLFEPAGPA